MTTFLCKACGLILAEGLSECPGESLCLEDGKPMLPLKGYFISTGKYEPEQAGDYLINVDDLVNTRLFLEMKGRFNGCCGLDGFDGINHVCLNGHEVATVRNDCWMPSHAILSTKMVTIDAQQVFQADHTAFDGPAT